MDSSPADDVEGYEAEYSVSYSRKTTAWQFGTSGQWVCLYTLQFRKKNNSIP